MAKLSRIAMVCWALVVIFQPSMVLGLDRYKSVDNATPQEIADGIGTKFTRGMANIATGWGELPKQIYYTTVEDGWAKGVLVGPLKGLVMTVVRTVAGVGEVVTFISPYPGFYEPLFDPAYVWEKE
jgi:putative exosortase-associated protein (TIGR04073 family)